MVENAWGQWYMELKFDFAICSWAIEGKSIAHELGVLVAQLEIESFVFYYNVCLGFAIE